MIKEIVDVFIVSPAKPSQVATLRRISPELIVRRGEIGKKGWCRRLEESQ